MLGLFLLGFATGCSSSTLFLADRDGLYQSRPVKLAALRDLRAVRGEVTDVSLPFFRSPSLSGDTATLTASVPRGSIPGRPELSVVELKYDCNDLRTRAEEGSTLTFMFHPDGRFVGVLEWIGLEL